jgi:DNA polymerase/3'-5' exonuclease PolX
MPDPMNRHIADHLEEAAQLLHDQGANRFRVNTYLLRDHH